MGLGAATLWRSRRTDDRLWRRYTRRLIFIAATLFAILAVVLPVTIAYIVTHAARAEVPPPDLGAAYEDVAFTTSGRVAAAGVVHPLAERCGGDLVPGPGGLAEAGKLLARHGYGALLFDRRGEGESEGDPKRVRLGVGQGLEGRRRIPEAPPRRGRSPDRRARPLRGRRGAPPDRLHPDADRARALHARRHGRALGARRRHPRLLDHGRHVHAPHEPRPGGHDARGGRAAPVGRIVRALLAGRPRAEAGDTAPAHGLYLAAVAY